MPEGMAPAHSGSRATKPRANRASGAGSSGAPHTRERRHGARIEIPPPRPGPAVAVRLPISAMLVGAGRDVIVIGVEVGRRPGQMGARGAGTPGGARLRALREQAGKAQLWVEAEAELGTGY